MKVKEAVSDLSVVKYLNSKIVIVGLAMLMFLMVCFNSAHAGPLINKHLPKYLKMDLEFRHRLESRDNFDFSDMRDDVDTFHLLRTRLGITYNPVKPLSLFIQGQDSRISNADFDVTTTFENFMDIRQLWVNYEERLMFEPLQLNKASIKVGRQEFSYGAQRLLGAFNWSNVAQTFDGGKAGFHFAPAHLSVDLFGGDKSPIKSPREADDLFDASVKERIYGYYASAKEFGETLIEQYWINRQSWKNISFGPNGSSEVNNHTVGGRLKKTFKNGIDYELELARQFGNFRDRDVEAMMGVGIIGYTWEYNPWKPRVGFEFDYGSGDSDPTDSSMKTFDNLYPTNHLFYGFADFISLQNLNDYRYQFSFKPHKKWKVQTDLHMIYLDTPKDSWYNVGRGVARTAAAGSRDVDPHVGNEIDLIVDYKVNDYASMHLGYSHFFAGKYLQATGANDDADYIYAQTTVSF
jgi:hypothetical protein